MLTASDIKNINFSNARRGYNPDEVEAFLDNLEADYRQYEGIINGYKAKIEELQQQIEGYKSAQESIQNVLLSAQKLADQIVKEAREKSEEIVLKAEANIDAITNQEKELASAFEMKANERKAALQKELDDMVTKAELKAKGITDAANDAVARQQMLFDKLKVEIAAFKTSVNAKYKEHLSILQSLPDTVDMEPQKIAEIVSAKIENMPNVDDFMPFTAAKEPEVVTQPDLEAILKSNGFTVENTADDENE